MRTDPPCATVPGVAICSVARIKRSGHPDCPRAGLDTSVAMGCSIFTGPTFHATRHAPRASHTAAATATAAPHTPCEHTWRLVHNPRLPQSAASISCRSQSDAHSEPPDAESYGPCLLGAWPWQRGCPMSLRTLHPPPDLAAQPSNGLPLTLTPHRYGTQVGSRLCYNLGRWPRRASGASKGAACMHSHRASHRVRPAHRPRARFQ